MENKDQITILTFSLDENLFAVPISCVREVQDMEEITRIPHALPAMLGVFNLRGSAVPVLDLRLTLNLPAPPITELTRIIIFDLQSQQLLLGGVADRVQEVSTLQTSLLRPPPSMGAKIDTEYIQGIIKTENRFLTLLDIEQVVTKLYQHQEDSDEQVLST